LLNRPVDIADLASGPSRARKRPPVVTNIFRSG